MGRLRNFEAGVFRRLRREPPAGKIHRIAFWLFIAYLVFLAARLLPGAAGTFFRGVDDLVLPWLKLDAAYGPFSVSVGLMIWAFLTGLILLAGAHFSANRYALQLARQAEKQRVTSPKQVS